jgi:hypothetical protein
MNHGGSLNSTTINGWRGDVSVRVQVLAFAVAVGAASGRVYHRSKVAGQVLAQATAGRVWSRSIVTGLAQADASVMSMAWRRVFAPLIATAEASAVNLGHVLVLTPVRVLVDGVARALCDSIFGRVFARSVETGQAQADAAVVARVHARSIVSGQARAEAWITLNIDRRIPWDEPAPECRTFIVPSGTRIFYVV